MIVYHGSTSIIKTPDVNHSKRFLDFGQGFYVTSYRKQAERWARRKSLRNGNRPILNSFEMETCGLEKFIFLNLHDNLSAWLDFVCACRKGGSDYCKYDVISGPVADDDVFKTIDMFFRGLWDKEKTLSELRFSEPNDQYCFVSQEALTTILSFKDYKALDV